VQCAFVKYFHKKVSAAERTKNKKVVCVEFEDRRPPVLEEIVVRKASAQSPRKPVKQKNAIFAEVNAISIPVNINS